MRKQGMSWTDNLNLTRRRGNLNLHLNKIKQILLEILQKTDYYIEVPQILCNIKRNENMIIFTYFICRFLLVGFHYTPQRLPLQTTLATSLLWALRSPRSGIL